MAWWASSIPATGQTLVSGNSCSFSLVLLNAVASLLPAISSLQDTLKSGNGDGESSSGALWMAGSPPRLDHKCSQTLKPNCNPIFQITIKLSGCNDDLQDEAEICLGLIPLHETVQGTYVHPLADRLPAGPVPPLTPPAPGLLVSKDPTPMQTGYPTVPDGTSYFVQVNQQVIHGIFQT